MAHNASCATIAVAAMFPATSVLDGKLSLLTGALLLLALCVGPAIYSAEPADDRRIATLVAQAACLIQDIDHVSFSQPLSSVFSEADLAVLEQNKDLITPIVTGALNQGHSIWGAKLAAGLGILEAKPFLRLRVLEPQRCYGWEGYDYTDESSYLRDNQYMYSACYIESITQLCATSSSSAVGLTSGEVEEVKRFGLHKESEHYWWSLWIQKKLQIP